MNCRIRKLATFVAAGAIAIAVASPASAQVFTGRIDVTVEDATGGRLPGVNVDLTGPSNQSQVSDAQGQAHFLNLPVGTYTVKAALSGFNTYTNGNVQVATGASTPLGVRMSVAGTAETVNVTAATPIIDTKRETTTTNVTLEELQNIPSARDPWVVMQTVPTIYVDRVNVGGSESGQQSGYIAKGAQQSDNTWNLDGVPITDMGATGSTPTYYNFDMFQEMAVTTGGADASNPTPGAQLNLVLKKGSNTAHGGAQIFFENEGLQGNNLDPTLAQAIGGSATACKSSNYTDHCGNRTDKYLDNGFDLGGPILKDRLWGWGSIARTDVRNLTLVGTPDETILKNYALKIDGMASPSVRGNFSFFEGNKIKNGRSASATRPPETTWDQTGPTKFYKGEGNFVARSNLFVSARYAYISGGFQLFPEGGLDKNAYQDDNSVWHGSYYFYKTDRPQYYAGGDASAFAGKHEVKFGFSYRRTPVDSLSTAPGNHIITYHTGYPSMLAEVYGDFPQNTVGKYINGFVTDTISLSRATITGGIRFDHQTSSYSGAVRPAVPGFEAFLPALTAPAQDNVFDWNTIAPRIGVNYSVDQNHKTLVRASYSYFASQLPATNGSFLSPIQNTYLYFGATDKNGNGFVDVNEVDFTDFQGARGFDPKNPTALTSVNRVSNPSAPITQEFLIGLDHELRPNFGVSATYTYRHFGNLLWRPRVGLAKSGFVQTGAVTGTFDVVGTVNEPYFAPITAPPGGGRDWMNRDGYHQRYQGFEVSATKRMSNRWMARFGFSTNDYREYFDNPATAIEDPTRAPASTTGQPTAGPFVDGGLVSVGTGGSGKSNIYLISPRYQLIANGMYQGPWGVNFGANYVGRQGFGQPVYATVRTAKDPNITQKRVLLSPTVDGNRLPMVNSLDARVEKAFKFSTTTVAVDLDVFNLFNAGTVLGRQYDVTRSGATGYNQILEVMNPRIARIGARFTF